jgi:transcriptional regulator with XRE-family HTH domain
MAHDSKGPPLYRRLRNARRARGLTQCALAEQAGCKQSALSMMESGRMEALARGTIEKIAGILDVALEPESNPGAAGAEPSPAGRAICPNGDCPSNVPFVVNGERLFWPRRQPAPIGRHCVFCGEVLERNCRQCRAPVTEGACCPQCGTAYVLPPPAYETGDVEAWAERRRRQMAEWRALLDVT